MRPTRGNTRHGRLARLDALLPVLVPELADGPGTVVDLGLGAQPWTTLELQASLAAWNPALQVVGADQDAGRLAAAAAIDPTLPLVLCGFDVPLRVRLLRAVNLLRQYPIAQATRAHTRLGDALVPGGVVLVGATDKPGGRFGLHLLRRGPTGLDRESLVLGTDCTTGFAPWALRDTLPRDLRHGVRPGTALHAFFSDWHGAWFATRTSDPLASFRESVRALSSIRPGVQEAAPGVLLWRPAGGIPR